MASTFRPMFRLPRPTRPCLRCLYSTETSAAPPPLLLKLRTDLKTAMRNKDTARLSVLRAVLAEVTNASKTSSPVQTDMQLVSILRKKANASKQAAEEFGAAGRDDLKSKETEQIGVLEEYAGSVETVGESEITQAVQKVVDELKSAAASGKVVMGDVLKKLLGPAGYFEGKAVEKSEVARIVKQVMAKL